MAARFVHVDHDTPLLLPPDLRNWISKDHMVHFIMDAVDALNLTTAKTNERGTGSAQYPPATMLALLIYCYATGTFASRRIETLTYENVAVRYLVLGRKGINLLQLKGSRSERGGESFHHNGL